MSITSPTAVASGFYKKLTLVEAVRITNENLYKVLTWATSKGSGMDLFAVTATPHTPFTLASPDIVLIWTERGKDRRTLYPGNFLFWRGCAFGRELTQRNFDRKGLTTEGAPCFCLDRTRCEHVVKLAQNPDKKWIHYAYEDSSYVWVECVKIKCSGFIADHDCLYLGETEYHTEVPR